MQDVARQQVCMELLRRWLLPPLLLQLLLVTLASDQRIENKKECPEFALPSKPVGILLLVNQSLNVADQCEEYVCQWDTERRRLAIAKRNCTTFLTIPLPSRCLPNKKLPFPECCLRPKCTRRRKIKPRVMHTTAQKSRSATPRLGPSSKRPVSTASTDVTRRVRPAQHAADASRRPPVNSASRFCWGAVFIKCRRTRFVQRPSRASSTRPSGPPRNGASPPGHSGPPVNGVLPPGLPRSPGNRVLPPGPPGSPGLIGGKPGSILKIISPERIDDEEIRRRNVSGNVRSFLVRTYIGMPGPPAPPPGHPALPPGQPRKPPGQPRRPPGQLARPPQVPTNVAWTGASRAPPSRRQNQMLQPTSRHGVASKLASLLGYTGGR